MIKESYEKHLKLQNDTLQKEREEHGQAIDKITKKYEKMLQD